MTTPEGFGAGGPFEGGPLGDLMRNLARFFTSQGPVNWEIARQMAQWAASGGKPENNPDPLSRARLEELIRVAEMHVSDATGLPVVEGGVLSVVAVTPGQWALRTLEHWKPMLEKLAERMTPSSGHEQGLGAAPENWPASEDSSREDPMSRLFASIPQVLGPFLFGLQAGSMVGQLAGGAMGQYDLPMPRPPARELMFVPATIDRFASDWSLAADEVRMWVCLRETAHHAVLGRPHVRNRLEALISDYVQAFSPTPRSIEDRLSEVDMNDMAGLQAVFGDPANLIEEMQNDRQREIQVPLRALLSAVVGYVDHVMDSVGRRLIGSYGPLTEALRRQRLEDSPGSKVLGQLFGVSLGAAQYEQGEAFVRGVLERGGPEGLSQLWKSEKHLPTPAEVAAPGLWLARIELLSDDDPS